MSVEHELIRDFSPKFLGALRSHNNLTTRRETWYILSVAIKFSHEKIKALEQAMS